MFTPVVTLEPGVDVIPEILEKPVDTEFSVAECEIIIEEEIPVNPGLRERCKRKIRKVKNWFKEGFKTVIFGRGQNATILEEELIKNDREIRIVVKQKRWYNLLNLFSKSDK
jgi:hypothetical protein